MEKNSLSASLEKLQTNNARFEESLWFNGAYLCGIDEVGRGAFVGPVVTAAVVLYPFSYHQLLVDSKILPENKRAEVAFWIMKNSWYSFGMADHHEIDTLGIYGATQNAMLRAFYGVCMQPGASVIKKVIVDAMPLVLPYNLPYQPTMEAYNYAETISISVAAASIIAKVKRDQMLSRWGSIYKDYNFESHKGYGTQAHQDAIALYGPTSVHRKTFIKKFLPGSADDDQYRDKKFEQRHEQVSIFR